MSGSWKAIHSLASDASLVFLGIHTALHWKWIVTNLGRYIVTPLRGLLQRPQPVAPRALAIQPVRIEKGK